MPKGKKVYEDYRSLSKEDRDEFKLLLEQRENEEFSDLLYEFMKSKKS